MSVAKFLEENFKHFNARETLDAAKKWHEFSMNGGKMVLALAGAMSTAELGISLAKMIRAGKIHAISTTGANLEEDLFNLIGNKDYKATPRYRYFSPEDDAKLRDQHLHRVTDTCLTLDVMLTLESALVPLWKKAANSDESYFPFEFVYQLIRTGFFNGKNQVPVEHSWVIAACETNTPIYTAGWEDSTMGNVFAAHVMKGDIKTHSAVKSGTEQFAHLTKWYMQNDQEGPIGFFQIGGGIAGDFAMCVVPSIIEDHHKKCSYWSYFCHIGDSILSYGSYSGCSASEKVTWHKLGKTTPAYSINSDATIVAPLIFQYVLEKNVEDINMNKKHDMHQDVKEIGTKQIIARVK
ncbi:deoxyhypusine synthase family protein [Patescibacteria group bacterium]|nr:deoxyhypusine synthase family protein [Patescibacteria group bacterium]